MKKTLFVVLLLMLLHIAARGMNYWWAGGSSASWTDPSSWSPSRTIPSAGDTLQFREAGRVTVTNVPTETVNTVSIYHTTVTMQSGADGNNLLASWFFSVSTGDTLMINGTKTLTITSPWMAIYGAAVLSNAAHRLSTPNVHGIMFWTGASLTQGPGCTGHIIDTTGAWDGAEFFTGSQFISQDGVDPIALPAPDCKVVFVSGSRYVHQQANPPATDGRTYANFEYDYVDHEVACNGTGPFTCDTFTVTAGTFDFNVRRVNIRGDLIVNDTLNLRPGGTAAAACSLRLNGTRPQAIRGSGTIAMLNDSLNTVIDDTAGVSLQRDFDFRGALWLNNGDLSIGAHTLTCNGYIYSFGAGTLSGGPSSRLVLGGSRQWLAVPTSLTQLKFLGLNNSNGASVSQDLEICDSLQLTSGVMTLNNGSLTIDRSYNASYNTPSSFIATTGSGFVVQQDTAILSLYAIGPDSACYAPAYFATMPLTTDTVGARVNRSFDHLPFDSSRTVKLQWTLDRHTAGSDSCIIRLQWNGNNEGSHYNRYGNVQFGHWNGSGYDTMTVIVSGAGPYFAEAKCGTANLSPAYPFVIGNNGAFYPSGTPTITVIGTLTGFGNQVINTNSPLQRYQIYCTNVVSGLTIVAPSHFQVSADSISFYDSLYFSATGDSVPHKTIYVRFRPTTTGPKADSLLDSCTYAVSVRMAVNGNGIMPEPIFQASGVNFINVGSDTMTVRWTRGNGDSCIVLARAGSDLSADPADGVDYSAIPGYGFGTAIGGGYVMYKGKGTSVKLSVLSSGTTYYVRVYEYRSNGPNAENYLTMPLAAGSQTTTIPTYVWNKSNNSASWGTPNSWTPNRSSPGDDILLFNNGGCDTVTNIPTQSIKQLLVSGNTRVILTSAGSATVTISGSAGADLAIAAGSRVVNMNRPITITLAAGATASINDTLIFAGASQRLTAADSGAVRFNSGAVFVAMSTFSGNPFGTTSLNSAVFASGSCYDYRIGANPFGATAPSSVVIFQPGSLFKCKASGPATSGRTYANFELNYAGTVTTSGASPWTVDSLSVSKGFLQVQNACLNLKGNLSVAAGESLKFRPTTACSLKFCGTAAQHIRGGGVIAFNDTTNLYLTNPGGLVLERDLAVNDTLVMAGGVISTGTSTLYAAGATSRTSGYVDGNYTKHAAAGSATILSFETGTNGAYSPCTVAFDSVLTTGDLSCKTSYDSGGYTNAADSLSASKRYWTLTKGGGLSFDTLTVTLNYLDSDFNTNFTVSAEDTMVAGCRYNDGTKSWKWDFFPVTRDATNNKAALTKVAMSRLGVSGADFLFGAGYALLGGGSWLGVADQDGPAGPAPAFHVSRLYPNPARDKITFAVTLPDARRVRIAIYAITGQLMGTVADGMMGPGTHQLAWNLMTGGGKSAAKGVYFCRVEAGDHAAVSRFTVVR